jgi:hypothetical protein
VVIHDNQFSLINQVYIQNPLYNDGNGFGLVVTGHNNRNFHYVFSLENVFQKVRAAVKVLVAPFSAVNYNQ